MIAAALTAVALTVGQAAPPPAPPELPAETVEKIQQLQRAMIEADLEAQQAVVEGAKKKHEALRSQVQMGQADEMEADAAETEAAVAAIELEIGKARLTMFDAAVKQDWKAHDTAEERIAAHETEIARIRLASAERMARRLEELYKNGRLTDGLAVEEAKVDLALAKAEHKKAQLREQLLKLTAGE